MKDQQNKSKDFGLLMKLYDESQIQRRHHETHRATLTGIVVTLYVALLSGFFDNGIDELPTLIILLVLSVFGILCTLSYTERYNYYWRRSQVIRELMAEESDLNFKKILEDAKTYIPKDKSEDKRPKSIPSLLRHHKLWIILHIGVFVFSLICLIVYLIQIHKMS